MSDMVETSGSRFVNLGPWLTTPWTISIGALLAVLVFDTANSGAIAEIAASAFAGTLPYIALAVLLIAWLKAAGADAVIGEVFKGRENRAIVLAATFGGLAPFCSCEVIPFIAGLLAVGAPLSAIMAFWLSSPLIDPPTLVITASALGWPFAVGKAVSAVALGLFGGFAVKAMIAGGFFANPVRERVSKGSCCSSSAVPPISNEKPVWKFWREEPRNDVFRTELVENALFLVKWLVLAYVLEALLITYVPASMIAGAVGGEGVISVVIAALVGIPAYLNGYVAPPLVAGLMDQGMSTGAAMTFMVAGAVSCIPAMAAVWPLVHRAVFAAYLGLGVAGAIMSGLIFQAIV
ncbi:MAG: permease [Hyphomicrobiales bacterium]|nr:permease [Hyphomicrobiales bacterium]